MGKGDPFLVTTGAMDSPLFPLSWMPYPQLINELDTSVFSSIEKEMIQILSYFRTLSSRTLITHDREYGNGMEE